MERLMGSITIHRPATVPVTVLALGNGFDFWAIRAAREWPVGIQLTDLQSLSYSDPWYNIAEMPYHRA
jgi:hypothetical protein